MSEKRRRIISNIGKYSFIGITGFVLIVYALSLTIPVIWGLNAATMSEFSYFEDPFSTSGERSFDNFSNVFSKLQVTIQVAGEPKKLYDLSSMLTYTLALALGKPTLGIFFTTAMAYCLSRFRFRGSKFLYNFGIFLMIMPIYGTFGASMTINKALGVYNNLVLNILTSPVGCFSGMNFLMLYNAFKRIPREYSEAARIDGANDFVIYYKVVLPLVFSTVFVFWMLSFFGSWNDYATSLYWLPSYPTVAYGMWIFQDQVAMYGSSTPEILAGFMMTSIPLALFVFFGQNLITEKMQIGGLKG